MEEKAKSNYTPVVRSTPSLVAMSTKPSKQPPGYSEQNRGSQKWTEHLYQLTLSTSRLSAGSEMTVNLSSGHTTVLGYSQLQGHILTEMHIPYEADRLGAGAFLLRCLHLDEWPWSNKIQ